MIGREPQCKRNKMKDSQRPQRPPKDLHLPKSAQEIFEQNLGSAIKNFPSESQKYK